MLGGRGAFLLSAESVQTNGAEEITVGASPANKKKRTALAILLWAI